MIDHENLSRFFDIDAQRVTGSIRSQGVVSAQEIRIYAGGTVEPPHLDQLRQSLAYLVERKEWCATPRKASLNQESRRVLWNLGKNIKIGWTDNQTQVIADELWFVGYNLSLPLRREYFWFQHNVRCAPTGAIDGKMK